MAKSVVRDAQAAAFGTSIEFWLNLQTNFDLTSTGPTIDVSEIEPLTAACPSQASLVWHDPAIIKAHQVKHILADVDANDRQVNKVFDLLLTHSRFSFFFGQTHTG